MLKRHHRAVSATGAGRRRRRQHRRAGHRWPRRVAQSLRADLASVPDRRAVQQRRRRSGAVAALPGPQQTACSSPTRATGRRIRRATGCFRSRPTTSATAISATAATYERTGRFVISGLWDEIPQFYSVDTKTPYTMSGSPLLLDDATQHRIQKRTGEPERVRSAGAPVRPAERRDIGNVNLMATPTPNLDVTAAFTTTRHRGELPWGGSFGFPQRRRGGAAVRLAHQRSSPSAPSGRTAATCCASRTTARGSTTSTTRWCGTARCG